MRMKTLRILLVITGCCLIIYNIVQILLAPSFRFPSDASMGEMMSMYLEKLYMLIIGIFLLIFSTIVAEKIRRDEVQKSKNLVH
jgi:hypothetical membrane protein